MTLAITNGRTALILVDLQYDFVEGGALPVPGGLEVVAVANQLMTKFDLVVATQDWHPANHQSFASQHPGMVIGQTFDLHGTLQIAWPDHCVQGTHGADLLKELELDKIHQVMRKGENQMIDSYSGFFDNGHREVTGLAEYLHREQVSKVAIMGLATDYCVRFTALDSIELGFRTCLIQDGCRGVNLCPGDIKSALQEMKSAGVVLTNSEDWESSLGE